jgi:hypothetical protein
VRRKRRGRWVKSSLKWSVISVFLREEITPCAGPPSIFRPPWFAPFWRELRAAVVERNRRRPRAPSGENRRSNDR